MPWSGGSYTKGNNATGGWAGDASLGIGIEAGRHDTQDNDFAAGINQCLNKDGSNTCTGNLNIGGQQIINAARVGIGTTSPTDPLHVGASSNKSVRIDTLTNSVFCGGFNDSGILSVNRNGSTGIFTDTGKAAAEVVVTSANGQSTVALYTHTANNTAPLERLKVNGSGLVGIGQSSPIWKLHVGNGTSAEGAVIDGSNSGVSGGAFWVVRNGGTNICGIGNWSALFGGSYDATSTLWSNSLGWRITNLDTGAGTHTMKFNNVTGAWTYDTSSARYKTDIVDSNYGLQSVLALKPRSFKYKDSGKQDVGFIAEEVVQVVPDVVSMNCDNQPDAVSYDRLTSVLCKAIQELHAKVEALEAKLSHETKVG